MFCRSCGYEYSENLRYCPKCGESLSSSQEADPQPIPKKKGKLVGILIAIIVLLIAALISVLLKQNLFRHEEQTSQPAAIVTEINPSQEITTVRIIEETETAKKEETTTAAKQNVISDAPVPIENFKVTASNGYDFKESAFDPRGEVAVDVLELEYYVEFYLAGEYSTFTAKIDPTEYFNTSAYQGVQLKILADDVEIYQSPTITYKTDNLDVSVDINNAKYLAFELEYVGGTQHSQNWNADPILIYNAFVSN